MTINTAALRIHLLIALLIPFPLSAASSHAASFPEAPSSPAPEVLRLGERIYREGILPSGKPLAASFKEGGALPGTTYACISCHLRSGLGALAEGTYTPPINGAKLFRSRLRYYKGVEQKATAAIPPLRPAYTEGSLIEVLRNGRDPNGRVLSEAMPRYHLDDSDAKILVSYLRTLSAHFPPGVSETEIRFATVISEDAKPELVEAMLTSFDYYFNMKNNQRRVFANPRASGAKSRLMAENMLGSRELATKNLRLARWVLKGKPETWRGQLEEYSRNEPVFALLGGMVAGPWHPVHQFCEENGIPCLFPVTDLPVISEDSWYTLYLSRGYFQEGESAAHYLDGTKELPQGGRVLQVLRPRAESEALAAGFSRTWQELRQESPTSVTLSEEKALDADYLADLVSRERPAALLLWDDVAPLDALGSLATAKERPLVLFLSGRRLGEKVWILPESVRDFTYATYPFAFTPYSPKVKMGQKTSDPEGQKTLKQKDAPLQNEAQRVSALTNSLTQFLTLVLMDMQGNYYRDNLLDVAGMMADQPYPVFSRLTFGIGERYASRGCYIVQLSHGATAELVKKSGWLAR